MDVRIGVMHTPKEIEVELGEDADGDKLVQAFEAALAGTTPVLWVTDRRGRRIGVPSERLAYIELGSPAGDERRVGFASH